MSILFHNQDPKNGREFTLQFDTSQRQCNTQHIKSLKSFLLLVFFKKKMSAHTRTAEHTGVLIYVPLQAHQGPAHKHSVSGCRYYSAQTHVSRAASLSVYEQIKCTVIFECPLRMHDRHCVRAWGGCLTPPSNAVRAAVFAVPLYEGGHWAFDDLPAFTLPVTAEPIRANACVHAHVSEHADNTAVTSSPASMRVSTFVNTDARTHTPNSLPCSLGDFRSFLRGV